MSSTLAEFRDRVSLNMPTGNCLVGYFPGYDEPLELQRPVAKLALPGLYRLELEQTSIGVWKCLTWRNGTWLTTGYSRTPIGAAHCARRSTKIRLASDEFAWWGEAELARRMSVRVGGVGWSGAV